MQRLSTWGLLNLLVTYVVWGSTYLAIRVAVREGAGWGPFWLGASRVLTASVILLLVSRLAEAYYQRPGIVDLQLFDADARVGGSSAQW